jgi:hypothetical protein
LPDRKRSTTRSVSPTRSSTTRSNPHPQRPPRRWPGARPKTPPVTSDEDPEAPPAESSAAPREEGPWRRQLIRAALPRPEGQQPPATRPVPEFTIRQPNSARGHRHARRRSGGFGAPSSNGNHGPMRFGRSGQGQGQGPGGRRRRGRGGKKNN